MTPAGRVPAPDTLVYPRRRTHGRLEVRVPDGEVVARVRVPRVWRTAFEVSAPDGTVLCRGRQDGPFRRSFTARDERGIELVAVGRTKRRFRATRVFDGWPRRVHKPTFSAGWRLLDARGSVGLLVQARGAFPLLVRPSYLVHRFDPNLTIAEVVALVEINWQISARERAEWLSD